VLNELVGPGKAPCGTCPYRADVPAGIWSADEYAKLPTYDGEPVDQVLNGGLGLFYCHQQDGRLCAGWVGCHNSGQFMALRLHAAQVAPEAFTYVSPVPLFSSGAAAAKHGLSGVAKPDARAQTAIKKLLRQRGRGGRKA
jgi:hypothetical protein